MRDPVSSVRERRSSRDQRDRDSKENRERERGRPAEQQISARVLGSEGWLGTISGSALLPVKFCCGTSLNFKEEEEKKKKKKKKKSSG